MEKNPENNGIFSEVLRRKASRSSLFKDTSTTQRRAGIMDAEVYLFHGIHLMQRRLGDTIRVGYGHVYWEILNDTVTSTVKR